MFLNTGGGGKTQQPLQNQVNATIRHNSPYPQQHPHQTQQHQPHYEQHQGPVTFLTYPLCNVPAAAHGPNGGNGVGVGGGQATHVLYQTTHQPQTQPHPTQQPVGFNNAEQTLHYYTKTAPLPAHHMHHTPQQHTQIRNMITAVSHQRQPYVVSPNYFALSHAILPQTHTSLLTNTGPQHGVAAPSGHSMTSQIQNATPRNVAPAGPTTYVPPPFCTPPLLLGAAPTAVTSQPTTMLPTASGMAQPPSLQAYVSGGLSPASVSSAPINMPAMGSSVGTSLNNDLSSTTKLRKHAIPIINPDTLEIVTVESTADVQTQTNVNTDSVPVQTDTNMSLTTTAESDKLDLIIPQSVSIQTENEDFVIPQSVSIQTENEKSVTASVSSDTSDLVIPTQSQSVSTTDVNTDKDLVQRTSNLAIGTTLTLTTQSLQSNSESLKIYVYEDPNDTDADTNEQELEDDVLDTIDGNMAVACFEPQLMEHLSCVQKTEDIAISPADESDSEHLTETEAKSKDGQCSTLSMETSVDRKDVEVKAIEIQHDLETTISNCIVVDPKRGRKNKKAAKRKEKNQKKLKLQQIKSNYDEHDDETLQLAQKKSKQQEIEMYNNDDEKTPKIDKNGEPEKDTKNSLIASRKTHKIDKNGDPEKDIQTSLIRRYTLEELKAFAQSPESRKTPIVPCQKGDCISQLFVARQMHHHHQHLSQVGKNVNAINIPQQVHHSYLQMNFNESLEFINGKRRTSTLYHNSCNNLAGLSAVPPSTSTGGNTSQLQKKMPVIRVNLSLNEEIKLSKCENAWQPKFISNNTNNNSPIADYDDVEDAVKKVRGILNKLTAENFEVLLKEMSSIKMNSQEKMQKVMLLIFEKTVSEPNFAPTYAKFAKFLFDEAKEENKKLFNALLIKRLQTEFETNVNNADAKERTLQTIIDKLNETKDEQKKIELQAELEHQDYQFRRRAWGTVQFIGEMYKLHSLTADRVLKNVESLLDQGNEEKLEYMCKLLTTVGSLIGASENEASNNNLRMNKIFEKIQNIVKDSRDTTNKKTKICSRVRFMLQDLIDLRSRNWGQPVNLHNRHNELRRRQHEDRNPNLSSSSFSSFDRAPQRMSFGNNNRHNNYFTQKLPKSQFNSGQRVQQHSIDVKKLNFSRGDDSSQVNTKLGNKSIYMWRTTAGRQTYQSNDSHQSGRSSPAYLLQQPQSQQYQEARTTNSDVKSMLASYSNQDTEKLLSNLIEEYLDSLPSRSQRWHEEVLNIWQKTNNKQQICLVYYILMDYLHLISVKDLERNACANIFIYLMTFEALSKTVFVQAYEQFSYAFPDLLMDVPNGCSYLFQFLGPLLHERLLNFNDIWQTKWRGDQSFIESFVNAFVKYFSKEFGASYIRNLWHKEFKLDNGQTFMNDQQEWLQFVTKNKLLFLYDCKEKPEIVSTNANNNNTIDQHLRRLEDILCSSKESDLALDYIDTNVNINSYFIKNLTRYLCCDYATIMQPLSRTSSVAISKNSSTCSNTSSSRSTKNTDSPSSSDNNTMKPQLNTNAFCKNCLPLLRLCVNKHEGHEMLLLDSVVDAIQQEYDTYNANDLICGIFDIIYDEGVITKQYFKKWLRQRQMHVQKKRVVNTKNETKRPLSSHVEAYIQKLL